MQTSLLAFYRLKNLDPSQLQNGVVAYSSGKDRPLDTLLVPAGGGGLAAGIALALRAHGSTTRLIAVEPVGYDDLARSLAAGEIGRASCRERV